MKTITALFFAALMLSIFPIPSPAAETPAAGKLAMAPQVCPVSGDPAKAKLGYTYKGTEYHFCCKSCLRKFKKNPGKFIA